MPDEELELQVEAEVQGVLERYSVSVELYPGETEAPDDPEAPEDESPTTSFVCYAKDKSGEIVATMALHLPLNVSDMGRVMDLSEEAQSQCVSLAVVAMAKLLLLQEQSRPDFNPFAGDVAEA